MVLKQDIRVIMARMVFVFVLFGISSKCFADTFNPTLEWTCGPKSVNVALRTTAPFFGIVNDRDRNPNCTYIGDGTPVMRFEVMLTKDNPCEINFNKEAGSLSILFEVHEHKLLLLEQDRIFNVTCENVTSLLLFGDIEGQMLVNVTNTTDSELNSTLNGIPKPPPFEFSFSNDKEVEISLELVPVMSEDDSLALDKMGNHDVGYGQTYDLKVVLKSDGENAHYQDNFRVFNCFASSGTTTPVELIDERGCSVDKKILEEFAYDHGYAVGRIPSMFKFPKTPTMKLECAVKLCEAFDTCKPECQRKKDDPLSETEDLIPKLLGGPDDPSEVASFIPLKSLDKSASTIVHVLERREIPVKVKEVVEETKGTTFSKTAPTTSEPFLSCESDNDVKFLYKIIFVLLFVLLLGISINIFCCCKTRWQKRKDLRQSTGHCNTYWIDSPINARRNYPNDPFRNFPDSEKRASSGSYASVRVRNSRLNQNPISDIFQMSELPMRSPPNASFNDDTFNHSVFEMESTSGGSTFESPNPHSAKELSSIF